MFSTLHKNDKKNQVKHRKMERRAAGDKSCGGKGVLNRRCDWAKKRA